MSDELENDVIRVLSLGAGVQSTTVLRMMIDGEIERADHAIFADTGWEPSAVYEHLLSLESAMAEAGIEFHRVTAGNIRDDALAVGHRFASMPLFFRDELGHTGMGRRQCTKEYKVEPITRKLRELSGLEPRQQSRAVLCVQVIGISWDESHRMRDARFPWIRNEYPLVDRRITRQGCLTWNDERGYSVPPRSACLGCPFHSDDEWRRIKDTEEWSDVVEFDAALRSSGVTESRGFRGKAFLHKDRIAIDQVDLRTNNERGVFSLFDQDCEGMCGL